jgi:ketosteroid isomerase-like protein
MSRENVEVVRALLQAFNDGDYARCFDFIDPDVDWEDPRGIPGGGVHKGHDGVRSWFARWLAAWDDFAVDAEEFSDVGEHVVVTERLRGIGKSSRVPIDQGWVAVYTLSGRRIVRRTDYPDRRAALEAVQDQGMPP